jgi:hypothetical protein
VYVGGSSPNQVTVKGTFTYSGNTVPWDASQPVVAGHSSIS